MSNYKNGKINLYIMRHGETILNRAKRTQGWCDGVLTKEGTYDVKCTGLGLKDIKFVAAYSSDLGRARKSAQIIINENKYRDNINLIELEGLREVSFGKYEGELEKIFEEDMLKLLNVKSFEEADKLYELQKEYCNACATLDDTNEAENYEIALKRSIDALDYICKNNMREDESNILIVAHGGIIRLIVDYIDKNINTREVYNASISKITFENGKYSVKSINDISYRENGKKLMR